ncbi:MAG: phosphate acyltransferase PlsX [Pelotomaculum sp.]|uniref:Phosphate acyltransferase n=1 Tax=Pelotomaculum thermopropionicum (strain DSM 13744 / JCM 10971 / SI) TaxID=370438 RepID=PLSX_PELTS|nr:RecName: Full=Phosphate acyltransferase; AltName: Full=Acyl-ACP phosphotransacylase; AltName: Full=Acyl-[acyl-carrier-protein]--phosphate acyltransferase; AltName: Full=Phosphate-acyl-ACP acyltransferase [Pelotomaculum thermopropionicum SI]NPV73281.1 phosphate acyltransferase PlsX [Pelotomaculum sp.]BAF59927.1 fatty acid/phospholipid biosynthesis enzyme [Pelotomaculum thermopropionicum SI]
MKIAIDAMGGDYAPREIVKGALLAAEQYRLNIILVGDEEQLRAELGRSNAGGLVNIVHAPEVIEMREHPAVAVRRKKNSSIVKATQLVRDGEASALVSAGSTGAAMAAALFGLGRIKGIDRPAIAGVLPNEKGLTVLLDAGANVDCKPYHLLQFGVMGYLYAKKIFGITCPRVGLLSNGEEETKGNEVTLAAYHLLQKAGINFVGNIEGRDLFNGNVDVAVCDGFVGNVVLKAGEGLAGALFKIMKEEISKSWLAKIGTVMAEPALKGFKSRLDYAEYGGAPLLGVNGISIICHGSSTAKAVKNAIRVARESVENRLLEDIRSSIESIEVKGAGGNLVQEID